MNGPLLSPDVPIDLTNCDLEPIHILSLTQPHGLLLAARGSDLLMLYASENAPEVLGVSMAFLLGQNLTELLGAEAVATIEETLGKEECVPRSVLVSYFPITGETRFDVVAHRMDGILYVELVVARGERRWDTVATRFDKACRELSQPRTLSELFEAIPPLIRELTGYDRVMVYKFDRDGHGEVVGEAKADEMEPFLGLHYPAMDIPRQARKLYLLQRIRAIVDVNCKPVRVLGNPDLIHGEPLDMSYCGLRAVSPIHIEYLQNMGVGSTLGLSLIHRGELWGMILCHHRSPRHLAPEVLALSNLLGVHVSLLVGAVEETDEAAERLDKKTLLETISAAIEEGSSIEAGLQDSAAALLKLAGADGAIIRIGKHIHLIGRTPGAEDAGSLMSALLPTLADGVSSTDRVGTLVPAFAHLTGTASGAFLVAFNEPNDGLVWFRGEIAETVEWAGKPDAKVSSELPVRLSPRRSFALWEEVQSGRSRPWRANEIEAALVLQRIVVKALLHRCDAMIAKLSYSDPLTGLINRQGLLERIRKCQAVSSGAAASILCVDLDQFRSVNGRFGRHVGDELLKQVGKRMGVTAGGCHLVARIGGNEFVIFCEDTDIAAAQTLAEDVREALAEPFVVERITIRITASVGIAPLDAGSGTDINDPLRVADTAMYVAKHQGGNRVSALESRERAESVHVMIEGEVIAKRRAAAELANSYARLNSVLESTSDQVLTIGRDWIVTYANSRALKNLRELTVGANYWSCFPVLLGTSTEKHLREAMQRRAEVYSESFYALFERWYGMKVFPVDEGITIFLSDITEEKMVEEQLAVAHLLREKRIEALSHMAGGLAHEISNPLAIIHGWANDLKSMASASDLLPPAEVAVICDKIVKTTNRAINILRGLRGFARDAGHDPMELASIDEIVDQSLELQQTRFERDGVELRISIDAGIPLFPCREVQIGQILTNLLNNGFDAIVQSNAKERWVWLTASYIDSRIIVDVTDSGPGIEDHFKAHLMEPFFTTKEMGLGMGVGLSLSRAIAQDHNGTLTLLPDTVHTCFRLSLPVTTAVIAEDANQVREGVSL